MSVKVRLKMKRRHFICEILAKQDFYLFQFKIAELVSQLPNDSSIKTWESDDVKNKFEGITCEFLSAGYIRKKFVVRYQKSRVTCFSIRGRGLYRKSFKKTPEKRKSGISEEKIFYRPQKHKKHIKILQ